MSDSKEIFFNFSFSEYKILGSKTWWILVYFNITGRLPALSPFYIIQRICFSFPDCQVLWNSNLSGFTVQGPLKGNQGLLVKSGGILSHPTITIGGSNFILNQKAIKNIPQFQKYLRLALWTLCHPALIGHISFQY